MPLVSIERHRWFVVSEKSSQSGLLHFVLLVLLRRCVERWGLGRLVEMLIGTSPWVAVHFPLPPPALGARLLTVQYVLVFASLSLFAVFTAHSRSQLLFTVTQSLSVSECLFFRSIQTRSS